VRRIVNSTYVSLDGVIEHLEKWHFEYLDDAANQFAWEQLEASDALLMGRATYEGFAEVWPGRSGKFADKINGMRKYVASTTLGEASWSGATVLRGDLAAEVARVKREPGGDILMYGYGPVAETLLRRGLLDELRLWVHPVLAGIGDEGDLLFRRGETSRLDLVGNRTLDSGLVILSYRPAGADAGA
jgi:dihydrofolate reductase